MTDRRAECEAALTLVRVTGAVAKRGSTTLPNTARKSKVSTFHFLHIRPPHANALPLIITHGWPGSVIEFFKIIEPLTNPTSHGGKAEDAFHVVAPSLPGFAFSGKPGERGWNAERIARRGPN